jgi:hypothetical protein
MKNDIIFIGDGRDFHAIDWYRTIKKECEELEVYYLTDLIEAEGHTKILKEDDLVLDLINIDWLLLKKQSTFGNIWRNGIKIVFFPLQVYKLKKIAKKNPNATYHAHTMYYLFLSWLANIKYIGSPQGDEILIRPYKSQLYKYFATKSLKAAKFLIVDSNNLKKGIHSLSGKVADVIQYGIDVESIYSSVKNEEERSKVVSIRALYPLYRIHEIIVSRNRYSTEQSLIFFYPFWEESYKRKIENMQILGDEMLGRIPTKLEMYKLLANTIMAISIPESDSSPRSVYEAIFCGCCVVVSYNQWIDSLPVCMRKRVYVCDLNNPNWFQEALLAAKQIIKEQFSPNEEALDMFDQVRSMRIVANKYYRN